MLRIICVSTIVTVGLFGCIQASQSTGRVAVKPPLVIVEGAKDVRHTSEHDGVIEYWNEDAYPAGVTIKRLDSLLLEAGWRSTDEDVLSESANNDLRTWGTSYEPSGEAVHQWSGTWKNAKGDFVTYVLRYRVPNGKPIPAKLEILGVYMTSERVQRLRKAVEKIPR